MILVALVIAVIAGWLSVPHYRAPKECGEDRLREQAVEYYAAMRRIDYLAVVQLFTPARQLKETEELEKSRDEYNQTVASVPAVT